MDLTTLSQRKEMQVAAGAVLGCSANTKVVLEGVVPVIERGKNDLC